MARKRKGDKVDGWINLDKPIGLTSTQAMAKVRRALNAQKAGHAGTLDPLASGILPIAIGEATKTIQYVQDSLKTYSFTITWGEQRDTDDSQGDIVAKSDVRPTEAAIKSALPAYIGEIQQIPPKFSAIKIDGQRAYDLARNGEEVELKPRTVFIQSLELLNNLSSRTPQAEGSQAIQEDSSHTLGMTETSFIMTCGKGTYVRSLARDLAADLGTLGYISALRREQVGVFTTKSAISLAKLEEMGNIAALAEALLPLETVLDDIPALALREEEMARLRSGQTLSFMSRPDFERLSNAGLETEDSNASALTTYNGKAIALVTVKGASIKPVKVFNT